MSSSKGSKRISVFDRLGPGNDEVSIIITVNTIVIEINHAVRLGSPSL